MVSHGIHTLLNCKGVENANSLHTVWFMLFVREVQSVEGWCVEQAQPAHSVRTMRHSRHLGRNVTWPGG